MTGLRAQVDVPDLLAGALVDLGTVHEQRARFRFFPSGSTQVSTRRSVPRSRRVYAVDMTVM